MDEDIINSEQIEMSDQLDPNEKHRFLGSVYDWFDSVVASVIVVIILFTFVFRSVGIVGSSMNNTLFEGDRVIIYNLFYTPKQGDIVVVSRNASNDVSNETEKNEPIIKRVIATAGQEVNIVYGDDGIGHVYVDGIIYDETIIKEQMRNVWFEQPVSFPQTVPEGHIFVLGDNRNHSKDSRDASIGDNGMVDTRYVLGKAMIRVFPFSQIGVLK